MKAEGLAVVVLLAVGAAVAQAFGRFTYGVLLPAIRVDLGVSNTVAGTLGTANVAAYLLGTLVVAWASSRYRLLPVLRVGFAIATAGLVLTALTPNVWVLAIGLFLSGLGGAIVWIPTPAVAADALVVERRGRAVAVLGSGIGLGVVFTSQLSSFIRSQSGDGAWRQVYVVQAVIAVVVMAAVVSLVSHRQLRPSRSASVGGGFVALRRMSGWRPITVAYTAFGLLYLMVIAFLTTRLEDDSGWTSSQTSLAFTLFGLATVGGAPLFIALTNRFGSRAALTTAFGSWAVLVLAVLPGWLGLTFAAAIGLGFAFAGIPSMITLHVVEHTSATDYGPSFAAATLAFGVAQIFSPQIGGAMADLTGSLLAVFMLSSALAVVGVAAALRLPPAATVPSPPTAVHRQR